MPINQTNQVVSPASMSSLLASAPAPLTGWYSAPLEPGQADTLRQAALRSIQAQLRAGKPCFQQRLLALVCCDGTPAASQAVYIELLCAATSMHERALLELVYGQWLTSRKLLPAMRHLASGFRLAAPLLASEDYFRLLRRHDQLACLVLSTRAASPQDLVALLTEAAVTDRLQRGIRTTFDHSHRDTLG
jgi:hypothetical protein